jgi:hypothetical protein
MAMPEYVSPEAIEKLLSETNHGIRPPGEAYGTPFVNRLLCVAMKNIEKFRAGVPNHYARTAYRRFHSNLHDLGSCFLIIVDYEISQIPWVLISLDVDLLRLLVHCQFACRQHCAGSLAVGRED